jgi:peptidoglycan/LPS O-acetylase OafA/YrhL
MTIDNQIFKPFLLIIEAGIISVDVFFMLGGFFLAFVFLRQDKNNLSIYPLGIIQRALRIWPAYIIAMMFYYSVFMQLGSGPSWSKTYVDVQTCSTMWRSIFFIENLVDNGRVECLGWSWYLQVDFQLFLISLFLLFLYNWKKVVALIVTLFFMFASTVFCFQYTFR